MGQFLKSGNAEGFYNPSSVHQEGQRSRAQISKARDLISEILECQTENILLPQAELRRVIILLVRCHTDTYKIENVLYLETEHSAVIETVKSTDINKANVN